MRRIISEKEISVDGIKIKVIKKTNMKNLYIRVKRGGDEVVLTAPAVSDGYILNFAKKNIEVLKKHINDEMKRSVNSDKKFVDGEKHFLWGRPYNLRVVDSKEFPVMSEREIFIYVKDLSDSKEIERNLNEFYRRELRLKLETFLKLAEDMAGVSSNEVRIKNMKTRWGTCNIKERRVWVNLNLAKYDEICLLYILLHELTHLKEKITQKDFIKFWTKLFP